MVLIARSAGMLLCDVIQQDQNQMNLGGRYGNKRLGSPCCVYGTAQAIRNKTLKEVAQIKNSEKPRAWPRDDRTGDSADIHVRSLFSLLVGTAVRDGSLHSLGV